MTYPDAKILGIVNQFYVVGFCSLVLLSHALAGFVILLRNCTNKLVWFFAKFRLEAEASLRLCSARAERIGKVVEAFCQGHVEMASQSELGLMGQEIHRRAARQGLAK